VLSLPHLLSSWPHCRQHSGVVESHHQQAWSAHVTPQCGSSSVADHKHLILQCNLLRHDVVSKVLYYSLADFIVKCCQDSDTVTSRYGLHLSLIKPPLAKSRRELLTWDFLNARSISSARHKNPKRSLENDLKLGLTDTVKQVCRASDDAVGVCLFSVLLVLHD